MRAVDPDPANRYAAPAGPGGRHRIPNATSTGLGAGRTLPRPHNLLHRHAAGSRHVQGVRSPDRKRRPPSSPGASSTRRHAHQDICLERGHPGQARPRTTRPHECSDVGSSGAPGRQTRTGRSRSRWPGGRPRIRHTAMAYPSASGTPWSFAEGGLPVLAAVEDAEDVDHELTGRLVDLVGDERPPPECCGPHARSDVVASSAGEREHQDAVDVVEDRRDGRPSGVGRRFQVIHLSS